MTTFEDGPAAGQTLMLRRSPLFLRVVTDPTNKNRIDALDQIDDNPGEFENPTAYVRVGKPIFAFVDFAGKAKSLSGAWPIAKYVVLPESDQPPEEVLRDSARWQRWCKAMAKLKSNGVA